MSFSYRGSVESSKSLVNRALILQYFHPELNFIYKSQAHDVLVLEQALLDLQHGQSEFHLENSGSGFRFFSVLLSVLSGCWKIRVSSQLARRPQEDFLSLSRQLGIQSSWKEGLLTIDSLGWSQEASLIEVDLKRTSQFLSGIYLVATQYESQIKIRKLNENYSSGYEKMTCDFIKTFNGEFYGEKVIGADWSSVIYLLSFCFLGSQIEVLNADFSSFEPDFRGLKILEMMGLKWDISEKNSLKAYASPLKEDSFEIDFQKNSDLVPIMSALLFVVSLRSGHTQYLKVADNLVYKESNRRQLVLDMINRLGGQAVYSEGCITISAPQRLAVEKSQASSVILDSGRDHRMIMSYEWLRRCGFLIAYENKEDVSKSCPQFFEIING